MRSSWRRTLKLGKTTQWPLILMVPWLGTWPECTGAAIRRTTPQSEWTLIGPCSAQFRYFWVLAGPGRRMRTICQVFPYVPAWGSVYMILSYRIILKDFSAMVVTMFICSGFEFWTSSTHFDDIGNQIPQRVILSKQELSVRWEKHSRKICQLSVPQSFLIIFCIFPMRVYHFPWVQCRTSLNNA